MKFSPQESLLQRKLEQNYLSQMDLLIQRKDLMQQWIEIREKSITQTVQRV